jgi:hypothetical protein
MELQWSKNEAVPPAKQVPATEDGITFAAHGKTAYLPTSLYFLFYLFIFLF